jgi:hypothetical protein
MCNVRGSCDSSPQPGSKMRLTKIFLGFRRILVVLCLTACGPREADLSREESQLRAECIATSERFMRAVVSADSATIEATTSASFARHLRSEPDSLRSYVRSALATFRPGALVRGGNDLLLEFRYVDGEQRKGFIRFTNEQGLKVAGFIEVAH